MHLTDVVITSTMLLNAILWVSPCLCAGVFLCCCDGAFFFSRTMMWFFKLGSCLAPPLLQSHHEIKLGCVVYRKLDGALGHNFSSVS